MLKYLRTALAGAMLLCASAHAQTSQSGLTTDTLANWIASNGVAAYQAEAQKYGMWDTTGRQQNLTILGPLRPTPQVPPLWR